MLGVWLDWGFSHNCESNVHIRTFIGAHTLTVHTLARSAHGHTGRGGDAGKRGLPAEELRHNSSLFLSPHFSGQNGSLQVMRQTARILFFREEDTTGGRIVREKVNRRHFDVFDKCSLVRLRTSVQHEGLELTSIGRLEDGRRMEGSPPFLPSVDVGCCGGGFHLRVFCRRL